MGDYSGGLIHWPPRENPDYDRECADWSAAEEELRMEAAAADAARLEHEAWELYNAGRIDDADAAIDRAQAKWREYSDIKYELSEGGYI